MILSAQSVRRFCQMPDAPMITPFAERTNNHGLSYGLSSAGYDIRTAKTFWLWPFRHYLGVAMEHFIMPDMLLGEVKDKSTLRRMGLTVGGTVIEPGWRGYLTLEINLTKFRIKRIRAGTPIAQILFKWLDEPTEQPYRGKYQDQPPVPQRAILESDDA